MKMKGDLKDGTLFCTWLREYIIKFCCAVTNVLPQFLKERFKIDVPHRFRPHTFLGPTFCDMCGQLMHGLFRQGVKCEGDSEFVVDLSRFCSGLSSSDPFPSLLPLFLCFSLSFSLPLFPSLSSSAPLFQ